MIAKLRRRMTLLVAAFLLLVIAGIVFSINYMNWRNISGQAQSALDLLAENSGVRPSLQFEDRGEAPAPSRKPDEQGSEPGGEEIGEEFETPADGMKEREPGGNGPGTGIEPGNRQPGRDHDPGQPPDSENTLASLSNYYVITLSESGQVIDWSSDRADLYTDEQIADMSHAALLTEKDKGRIGTQFFRLISSPGQTKGGSSPGRQKMLIVLDQRLEIMSMRRVLRMTAAVAGIAYLLLCAAAYFLIRSMVRPVQDAFDKQRQFVWDASHELKTPLAVIGTNAQVLREEVGENEYLGYITSEVSRTGRLLQSLLTLARMDQNTAAFSPKRLDLGKTVLSVALPFESTVYEAGRQMTLDVKEGLTCRADEPMIQQLTVILLSNALKYSDPHGMITVRTGTKGRARFLAVSNTGSGIAPKDLERIFDRFYRADTSHNRDVEGFGLGLSIAKTIVDAHKGKIRAESDADGLTTFTVTLPE